VKRPARAGIPLLAGLLLAAGLPAFSCSGSKRVQRLRKAEIQKRLRALETPGLVLGEFPLAADAVVDGDTVKVAGLDTSLRLLAIDTEETFKTDEDRRLYEQGFDKYLEAKRGDSPKPVKCATPLGMDAKRFAQDFFDGVRTVRLERDHPKDIRGRYDRYLVYVFAKKKGRWVNYNVEAVRAGMSPYFTKYSYSRRFHDQFVAAQREAQQKGIGIWNPDREHYRDYEERLQWWNARAEFIQQFERDAAGQDNYITLTHWDALRRLEQHVGEPVVVLGTVGEIELGDRGPTIVKLSRRIGGDFPLVFFDKDVFGSSRIARFKGEFVRVEGPVNRYRNKHTGREVLQIIIKRPGQISGSEAVPNYSGWDPEGRDRMENDPPMPGAAGKPEQQEQQEQQEQEESHAP
jgi:endonuclease YncB( thermonuclease family)